jgi:hypothetical protein
MDGELSHLLYLSESEYQRQLEEYIAKLQCVPRACADACTSLSHRPDKGAVESAFRENTERIRGFIVKVRGMDPSQMVQAQDQSELDFISKLGELWNFEAHPTQITDRATLLSSMTQSQRVLPRVLIGKQNHITHVRQIVGGSTVLTNDAPPFSLDTLLGSMINKLSLSEYNAVLIRR